MSQKEDDLLVEQHFEDMLANCRKSMTDENKALVRKAFLFANEAHKDVKRKSGEPYILHPIAVAKIATAEIGLGTKSVIAALLHDVVEDTEYSVEDIAKLFGDKVASIVDGLTKLSEVSEGSSSLQAENFRKIVLTLSDDLRVILIKLADRLHNMRTLSSMPIRKQVKIAGETLYIYAPLAHRMGLHSIKSELEDLSLKYEHPSQYAVLKTKLDNFEKENKPLFADFINPISESLDKNKFTFSISARKKSVFSVWSKMQRKNRQFDEIYDLLAVRIIFETKENMPEKNQCWEVYSMITDRYHPKPERIRDWVSIPKANGYEALHVTVMGPHGRWIEVQIRTRRMHEIAEKGFAAHWKYKNEADSQESELDKWLTNIREMLEEPQPDALEFLDVFKLNLFTKEITVFTPKGEIRTLPKGATALDFAFDIHTQIGSKCIGAKVNKQLVSISSRIRSGDQVEIITSDSQEPQKEWLLFVTTAKAKSNIKAHFKDERKEVVSAGMQVFSEVVIDNNLAPNSQTLRIAMDSFDYENKDDFYRNIGKGTITIEALRKALVKKSTVKFVDYWNLRFWDKSSKDSRKEKTVKKIAKIDKNKSEFDLEDYDNFIISKCCNPIPGDDVVAVQNTNGAIVVHSRRCPNGLRLMASHGDKILAAKWVSRKLESFIAVIKITGMDRICIANDITQVISKENKVNMKSVRLDSEDGIFKGEIHFYIHSLEDLENLIVKLGNIKGIETVVRLDHVE
ncbi:MAG: RelA/SpoT family protein [Marinifilaceae bacterium]